MPILNSLYILIFVNKYTISENCLVRINDWLCMLYVVCFLRCYQLLYNCLSLRVLPSSYGITTVCCWLYTQLVLGEVSWVIWFFHRIKLSLAFLCFIYPFISVLQATPGFNCFYLGLKIPASNFR